MVISAVEFYNRAKLDVDETVYQGAFSTPKSTLRM